MTTLELEGLDGTNPMGFLAALGVLVVASQTNRDTGLAWTTDILSTAVLHNAPDMHTLIAAIMADRDRVIDSVALQDPTDHGQLDDVKFADPATTRAYLQACQHAGPATAQVAAALIAEISLDRNGKAKPTDLHFTAGQQKFLDMVRKLGAMLQPDDISEATLGPWRYETQAPTLMWDVTDDRLYALSARDPSETKKSTIPGADWLAFRGLTLLPVVGRIGRTLTPGTHGTWKYGAYVWPLWRPPLNPTVTEALLAQIPIREHELARWTPPPGVHTLYQCGITRTDQGGYGRLQSPRTRWREQHPPTTDPTLH